MRRFLLTILTVCLVSITFAQQWHLQLEILEPAQKPYLRGTKNILLVNNCATQPVSFGHSVRDYAGEITNGNIDLSASPRYCLIGMAQALEDSRMFESVSILDISQNTTAQPFARTLLLPAQLDSLCTLYGADVVISLNQTISYDVLSGAWLDSESLFLASFEAYQNTAWSVFYKGQTSQSYTYQQQDTLLWEQTATTLLKAQEKLPVRQQALLDMSMYVGELVAKILTPQWTKVDRYLYEDKNAFILSGLDNFRHYELDAAAADWQEAYFPEARKKKDITTSAYAAANMALLYEMQGQWTEAASWAKKASEQFAKINTPSAMQQQVNMQWYANQLTLYNEQQKKIR